MVKTAKGYKLFFIFQRFFTFIPVSLAKLSKNFNVEKNQYFHIIHYDENIFKLCW